MISLEENLREFLTYKFSNSIENLIDVILAHGVVAPGVVVGGVLLAGNQLLRVEQMAVYPASDFVYGTKNRVRKKS